MASMDKKKRKVVHSEGRKMIANVYRFLKTEYEFTLLHQEPNCDVSHLRNITLRTADATGVSERTVQRVLKEEKNLNNKSSSKCQVVPKCESPSPTKPDIFEPVFLTSSDQVKPEYSEDDADVKVEIQPCHSPGSILPDLPQPAEDPEKNIGLSKEATCAETQDWLSTHRFCDYSTTFANFSGADLLRLSRDDIIQICGLADGIRLFNRLHAEE